MANPRFRRQVIGEFKNDTGIARMNTLSCTGDFNRDGKMDFAVCGRNGKMAWFENTGDRTEWIYHPVAEVKNQECGGRAIDLTGNGYPDIINGSDAWADEMSWWENPGPKGGEWKRHIIAKTGKVQQHDTLVAPVKNDGINYLLFTNQERGTTLYALPVPSNPFLSPWPDLEIIADDMKLPNPHAKTGFQPEEGVAAGDLDNDGMLEVVSGVSWFKWTGNHWQASKFTEENYITNKIAIADIDGDGKNEILLAEGDACIYGKKEGGKAAWFKPVAGNVWGMWEEHIIDTGLLDAHSIAVADLCGNGFNDIFLGEIGVTRGDSEEYHLRPPRLYIYENDGRGNFPVRHIIDNKTGVHEAVVTDLNGDGKLDIIGKPLHGPEKWKLHAWFRE
ncbi:MAG: VCBS repeat-containing protein [Treponema sp.]|jgi:hypothetical protein|nr:VCBS repeat-containing protein [Treponema sp.]